MALAGIGLGFPSLMIYRQDKQRPAFHEEQELERLAGLKLQPDKIWKTPPILQHGDLRFALLVCSELTNISYRAALRGKIDALFVPEWNQDTETFNALVDRSVNMLTNHASSRSNFFQRKTTGAAFISSMPFKMRALSSGIEATRIWRRKVRAIFEKAHSIRLSQEPCLGV